MPLYRLTRPYMDEKADYHERDAILFFDPDGEHARKPPKSAVEVGEEDLKKLKAAAKAKEGQADLEFLDSHIDITKVDGPMALSELNSKK